MADYIVGIDPDSKAHGVAIYKNLKLESILSLQLMEIMDFVEAVKPHNNIEFHIENVCAKNATFSKQGVKNQRAQTTVSRSLGKCQQAQIELERMLKRMGVEFYHHPISKCWKSAGAGKASFQGHTGWQGQSNEDTRSAAWFGFLGVKEWHKKNLGI